MSATKRYYEDCAEQGVCPCSAETCQHLDRLEDADPGLDWIGYTEAEVRGYDGSVSTAWGIDMESAQRLIDLGIANDEIEEFVECFDCYFDRDYGI
jgi:hypothetical protein